MTEAIKTESVTLRVADGSEMHAFVARPNTSDRSPALLVLQEAFGVNDHIRDVARRFADAGYLAVAPELFHRTASGVAFGYDEFPKIMPHMQALTLEGTTQDLEAAYTFLAEDAQTDKGRIGAIGYCMGGRTAWLANAKLPLKAAASYYGGRIAPDLLDLAPGQHGPILLVWGGLDKHIGSDQRAAVDQALATAKKRAVTTTFQQADHGFFCDQRPTYDAASARQAWALTLEFFATHI